MKTNIQYISLFIALTAGLAAMAEDHFSEGIQQKLEIGDQFDELNAERKETAFWQMCLKEPAVQWDDAAKFLLNELENTGASNPFEEKELQKKILETLSLTLDVAKAQDQPSDPKILNALDSNVKAIQNSKDPETIRSAYNALKKIHKNWNQTEGAKKGDSLDSKKRVTRAQAEEFIREMRRIQALQKEGFTVGLNQEAFREMAPYIKKHFPEDYQELIAPKIFD